MSEPKGRIILRGARADLLGAGRGRRQFSPVACFFHPLFLAGSKNGGTQNDRSGQFALVQTFLYGLVKDFRMSTYRERLDSWGGGCHPSPPFQRSGRGGGTLISGKEVSFLTLVVRALALHTAGRGFNYHWILLYLDPLWVMWGP